MARVFLFLFALLLAFQPASAQSSRLVALVVTVGDGEKRADAIQAGLVELGAETLRADEPRNAELRSILARLAREAASARATLVYLDAPVVDYEGRSFVLPAGAVLERAEDLFTQAIPIQAFSRSAAQADEGGLVIATVNGAIQFLPDGMTLTRSAPQPSQGAAPVVLSDSIGFNGVRVTFAKALRQQDVEIGAMLGRMQQLERVTLSGLPEFPVYLRKAASPDKFDVAPETAIAVAGPQTTLETAAVETSTPRSEDKTQASETLEELEILENSLSRAAKRTLQRKLRDQGFYKGFVDGIFGPQTRAAIRAFQSNRSEQDTGFLSRRQLLDLSS
ncbi:peptidoglycan-binding protein [Roseibium sp. RKSG952]|uniref:peptidoglycan-binding domain-containing protein n=1 Tax=Roseibium sp. RKSG952 TaxID=2529384 RepID=UPI0012BD0D52|nr:peptidoglycan-binding protein [Roseibium sp. RKSG952]MTI00419.1 peptidoglycan-binding protein [Roseibium sp. RKSG952]